MSETLSARENEIARLVAAGLSNKDVACQLLISERTVKHHLYNIFNKLGIDRRQDLQTSPSVEPPDRPTHVTVE